MANLQLAVNGEYFDQMKSGEKTEEYRLVNPYWCRRLSHGITNNYRGALIA